MATVSPPPPSLSPSPNGSSRRKPVPLHGLSPIERYDWGENAKSLPDVPASESPRLRQSPVSPVKVNFQPDDWARPSTGNIETQLPHGARASVHTLDRALSKTPDAPTPPPHTPLPYAEPGQQHGYQQGSAYNALGLRPASSGPRSPPTQQGAGSGNQSQAAGVLSAELEHLSVGDVSGKKGPNRNSRESGTTASTSQQQTSAESSATTSASSVYGILDVPDSQNNSADASAESSIIDDGPPRPEPVPQLQYHHSAFLPEPAGGQDLRAQSNPNLGEAVANTDRHLTPTTNYMRRSSVPRPQSAYSVYSDTGPRGRSSVFFGSGQNRAPSVHSRNSPETRPASFAELLNVPYPQPAPAPITFDNSQLRSAVGNNASLLSAEKTLEMYRQNAKKTNDFSILYSFAVFLIATAQEQGMDFEELKRTKGSLKPKDGGSGAAASSSPYDLVREARAILQKLANNGYPFAQYYLADGYASGLFNKGKEDYNSAFPLFVLAAKHGHAESAYRTALCYEFGWGCRKDPAKAVQFLRTAASKRHPGAMTRLGKACLSGDLGEKRYREGIKWLKLASEAADAIYNAAPYHLGSLYETGYGDDIFMDESYAAELFTQAAELGHPDANFRMGDAYEHGKLNCPRDPALSVHFYTGAAERGHAAAMMGLCAWYMVGAEPVLEKDEDEAYEWARRSAELGYVKAQYAVGYFTEMGIGCRRDILEANVWYVKAADAGDERAKQRLAAIRAAISGGTPMEVAPPRSGKVRKSQGEKEGGECIIM
ncbi:HCP-like protein [Trichocladium antarcticum]|uniref:HCP-like protein n=1 Tax=Trichocladium antarcticum TaxID=1450529 RepID=A0AAN6UCX9_9PEZI|nr:HCP-like protein [Trichocladium antarcticum]